MIGVLGVGGYEVPRQSPAGILSTLVTLLVLMIVCWLGIIAVVAVLEARDRYRRRRAANDVRALQRDASRDQGDRSRVRRPRTRLRRRAAGVLALCLPASAATAGAKSLGLVERPQHGGGNPTRGNSGTGGPGGVEGRQAPRRALEV
jgi:hypothetical protein